jgi:hypothetical protein
LLQIGIARYNTFCPWTRGSFFGTHKEERPCAREVLPGVANT